MKLFKLIISVMLLVSMSACQQQEESSLSMISESTMNRILVFVEADDEIMDSYSYIPKGSTQLDVPILQKEGIYKLNDDANEELLENSIYLPYALSYLFSLHGMGQKIGLTDCQDPFIMLKTDKVLLNKALQLFIEEEIKDAYQKAITQENEKIYKK